MRPELDETELVARLLARDKTALREIIERYTPTIYRVSNGILGNCNTAEEIAREVLIKLYTSVTDLAGHGSLHGWIHRITVNECYSFLHNKRLKPDHLRPVPSDLPMKPVAGGRPGMDQAARRRDFINRLLSDVPEDDRWLLIAKDAEGFTLADLSRLTGLNENAIKIRLLRIRRDLVTAAARLRAHYGNPFRNLSRKC
jgi:RNA polymerase sigma-70 factor (ECF subfamily)